VQSDDRARGALRHDRRRRRTIDYLRGRPYAPTGERSRAAAAHWLTLATDADAEFDREVVIDVAKVRADDHLGHEPRARHRCRRAHSGPGCGRRRAGEVEQRAALGYMGLEPALRSPGRPSTGCSSAPAPTRACRTCAAASDRARPHGRDGVTAWVVPGLRERQARGRGGGTAQDLRGGRIPLARARLQHVRAANGEQVPPGRALCLDLQTRNFVGRQGPGSRTHLASPAMAAAAAVCGAITM
jgi:3-isopropylmalate/(R)-2-methylmalate dehydratase large subunit